MKFVSLVGVTLAAAFPAPSGHAADAMNWDGYYAGLNAGAAIGTAKMHIDPSGSFLGPLANDIADGNF